MFLEERNGRKVEVEGDVGEGGYPKSSKWKKAGGAGGVGWVAGRLKNPSLATENVHWGGERFFVATHRGCGPVVEWRGYRET